MMNYDVTVKSFTQNFLLDSLSTLGIAGEKSVFLALKGRVAIDFSLLLSFL